MPAPRRIDWGPIVQAFLNRAPHETQTDIARRFGVLSQSLSKQLKKLEPIEPREPLRSAHPEPERINPELLEPLPPPRAKPDPVTRAVVGLLGSVSANQFRESLEAQVSQFQQDIASDVAFARERFRTYLDSGDARLAAVGVELWDRAIKHGRLNLGLPSEVVATDNRNARVVSITQASSTRRLL